MRGLFSRLGYIKKSAVLSRADEDRFFNGGISNPVGSTLNTSKQYMNAFRHISYVGNCVDIIASDIASRQWKICDDDGRIIKNDDIIEILNRPNEFMNFHALMYLAMAHQLLDGNSFMGVFRTSAFALHNNKPDEIYIFQPPDVDIINSEGGETRDIEHTSLPSINSYRVTIGSMQYTLMPEQVIHAKRAMIYNTIRGIGVVAQNQEILDADRFRSIYDKVFFRQGARPSFAMTPVVGRNGDTLSDPQYQKFKNEIRKNYEGASNHGRILVTNTDAKIHQLNLSHKDMEFLEQRKLSRSDVYSMFKIPPVISQNYSDAKYDSADVQKEIYYEITLKRYAKPLEHALTQIVKLFDSRANFRFVFPNIVPSEQLRDMYDRGIVTGNEYRELLGVEKGDEDHLNQFFMNSNLLPAGFDRTETQTQEPPQKDEPKKSMKKLSREDMMIHRLARSTKAEIEKVMIKEVKSYYDSFEKRAFAGVEKANKALNFDDIYNEEVETKEALKSARKMHTSAITISIKKLNESLGSNVVSTFTNPSVQLLVERLGKNYVDSTLATRKEEIRKILNDGLSEGVGVSEIKARLRDNFDTLNAGTNAWKADRIARAETRFAYDNASKLCYEDLGVERVKVVGCMEPGEPWDCDDSGSRGTHPISKMTDLNFKPNHTGTVVPVL